MPIPQRRTPDDHCTCPEPRGSTDLAQMIHLYRCERWSTDRIGAAVGISRQRVTRMLRHAGITLRARGAGGTRPDRRAREPDDLPALLRSWYLDSRMSSAQIAAKLGMAERTIRTRLADSGIPRRTRGRLNREDRRLLERGVLDRWYTGAQLSAADVAAVTDSSRGIVLRNAHDLGVAVRVGGPSPRLGPTAIALLDALYADARVAAVVARHHLPVVPAGAPLWQRFPDRVPLSADLVRDLYCEAGVAVAHIELLTGQPAVAVVRRLHAIGTQMRPPGGRCPFMRRWRANAAVPPSPA